MSDEGMGLGTYMLVKFGTTDFLQNDFPYESSLSGMTGVFYAHFIRFGIYRHGRS
ncbi:MAG: hypothetical protein V4507_15585 [Verrucomicrobiota bacterium]